MIKFQHVYNVGTLYITFFSMIQQIFNVCSMHTTRKSSISITSLISLLNTTDVIGIFNIKKFVTDVKWVFRHQILSKLMSKVLFKKLKKRWLFSPSNKNIFPLQLFSSPPPKYFPLLSSLSLDARFTLSLHLLPSHSFSWISLKTHTHTPSHTTSTLEPQLFSPTSKP